MVRLLDTTDICCFKQAAETFPVLLFFCVISNMFRGQHNNSSSRVRNTLHTSKQLTLCFIPTVPEYFTNIQTAHTLFHSHSSRILYTHPNSSHSVSFPQFQNTLQTSRQLTLCFIPTVPEYFTHIQTAHTLFHSHSSRPVTSVFCQSVHTHTHTHTHTQQFLHRPQIICMYLLFNVP